MADPQIRFDQMLSKLREKKFRITPQRLAVLKTLAFSDGHPSVEEIYDGVKADFPTTSLATVYKTVTLLKQLDELLQLEFSDSGNRYDGNKPFPHPHVICNECGAVIDLDLDVMSNISEEMAKKTEYDITSHRLDFYGVCPRCQKGK